MSEPTASDLAADVRASFEKLRLAGRTSDILKVWCDDGVEALDALVAQVDTLTRERDEAAEVAAARPSEGGGVTIDTDLATLREHLPADYLGPDPNDMDGEKWGQHPEALAALDRVEAELARLREGLEYAEGVLMRDPFDDTQRNFAAQLLRALLAEDGPA